MAIRSKSKLHNVKDVPQYSRSPIEKCGKGVTKVEDRTVVNPGDFNYAGTDNGLVNMTASIPMSLQRMQFHLKLFNYYTALSKDSNEDKESFLHLPSVTNTKASDVDVGCGYFRQRKYLERRKKYTDEGKKVQESESAPVASIDMAIRNFRAKYDQRRSLRDFYNSPKIINKKRHVEIQQHRYRHHLCRRERLELKHSENKLSSKKPLILFIGDRGTGTGSRIKGFRKYGGKWKQNINGEAVNVCITNECNTSQTCIFCFSPLTNPRIPGKKEEVTNKPRDALSALAIALVGLSSVMFGAAPPPFYNLSQITAEHYTTIKSDFCTRRDDLAATL
ncbi:hypothetical protein J3Q64DRAFT_1711616 [Phycomyces blakesleeanus]|uniref:PGG domain-containing protein n=1 Tax=Phycomyces blakesleeanus TaxID=4837 RepID=A0ABR3BE68_PHYBL